jgi:outer membrane protein OmpA-like peptidoglycan-associated protein
MNRLTSAWVAAAVSTALCAGAALPAQADETDGARSQPSKQSHLGAAAGLAVGALVAGPGGAIVGGVTGALIGDHLHRKAQAAAAVQADLSESEAERARLSATVAQLRGSLSEAQSHDELLDQTLQRTDEVGLDVSFRTDDDSVSAQAMSPLLKLGALLASLPGAQVRIAGYSDPRGSDAYNDELSLRRAENVAAVLGCAGVPRERMLLEAHGKGDSQSSAGDLDAYALERRVTVRLQLAGPGAAPAAQVASRD